MARAWVYDRTKKKDYLEAVKRAKSKGRQPPSRWLVQYYDRTGKLRSEVAPNKARAEIRRTELESALTQGTYVDPAASKVSVSEMAEKWLESRHDVKPSTWWKYRGIIDNHVNPKWGDMPLSAVHREDIAAWVASLLKPKAQEGSGLGPSQTRHAYRVLSMILEWCVPSRLHTNPARGIKLPIRPDAEHIYLTYEQIEALADAAGNLKTKYGVPTASAAVNRALILLLAYTGLRWGEAAALRVGRVDLKKRRLRIATTFYEVNGVQHEGLPKTGKRRTVPIPASLVPELERVIGNRPDNELVFRTARGHSLRANNWRVREFNAAVKAAKLNVEGLTPHKLRHSAASLAIAAGADIKVLQLLLGHADASVTLNIYGHLFPDRLDEVADVLDARRTALLDRRAA
ncbi:Phage integrase, N-terminal SAM-like domain [Amycolatopsis sacchari]|uniref:Phage integrase, N-terminal SAM-like domain n=1 Tax=Amycolatopsis sacchari TaxID=115433 RepID=A0A1I3R7T8_9PSEU|nr:site-specific integrase [Amycolatopsis sacchari]SFJ41296.1 Phage integrase, N-terminal SAM-like domain [Amycolatopsis sacchari]